MKWWMGLKLVQKESVCVCVCVCVGQRSVPGFSRVVAGVTTRGQSELFCLLYLDEKLQNFSVVFQIELKLTDF